MPRLVARLCSLILQSLAAAAVLLPAPSFADADDAADREESAGQVAARASTEELYDLGPLSDADGGFAALADAYRRKKWPLVDKLAADLVERSSRSQIKTAALLLAAMGQEQQQHWADAGRAWQQLGQSGPFAQRARRKLAELALRRGDLPEALAQWAAIAPWHAYRDPALLQMAAVELQRGHTGPARDALERIDAARLAPADRAHYLLLAGRLAARSGDPLKATGHLRDSWAADDGKWSELAGAELASLDASPTAADRIERILRRREVKPQQLQAWLAEADAATEDGTALRWYVRGALLGRDKKTREAAVALLRKAAAAMDSPLGKARALYALGDALGKVGQDEEALQVLASIAAVLQGDNGPAAAEILSRTLLRQTRLYGALNKPVEAAAALQVFVADHPQAEDAQLALWGLGWQHFSAGNFAKALEFFVKLEKDHGQLYTGANQPWRAKAAYWQGRCLQSMGQTQSAIETWTAVANAFPQTYYGILAVDRIGEIDPDRADRVQGPPPSHGEEPPPALGRLRVHRNPALDEAALLVRMGLNSEARAILAEQLPRGLPRDGVHLLATLYELQGNWAMASGVMARHSRKAARPDDSTAQMWRQTFSTPFGEHFEQAAQGAGIARSLLYAIARHESSFVPSLVSKAGAYGLVQLLPGAAKNVADLHGVSFGGAASLLQPKANLQLGALYLNQLLSFYRGNLPLAAAGYNAGPYAVRDWVKKKPQAPTDVFVEEIPYPATRAYVMQVTATAQTYAWLYPQWGELRRDKLGRDARLPKDFGPFMQKPDANPPQTSVARQ